MAGDQPTEHPANPHLARRRGGFALLALATIGVVYGDIGTSPLYALRECFFGPHRVPINEGNVLGVLSLVFWTLIIVVTLKYQVYVIRADNHGEGGILALMALVRGHIARRGRGWFIIALGLFGAALLYGDGILTPAISVLSAVEGLEIAAPGLERWVVPVAVVILIGVFLLQRHGTARVGMLFGPIIVVWFITIAVLGASWIVREPGVLRAVNPIHAVQFFAANGLTGFLVLGAVFLVATGSEAMYADLGHFGRRPIQLDWFTFVLPALLLNYFGQGALLLARPETAQNPFYMLAPSWGLYPLLALATMAAIIASQAIISGAFSLTRQAVQLGYLPRVEILHTSETTIGQIYIPVVNRLLMIGTIGLVLAFRSSSNIAGAYGIAVATTMVITTLLAYFVARRVWRWSPVMAGALTAGFIALDLTFFGANILKLADGGWVPLAIAAVVFIVMSTWERGGKLLVERFGKTRLSVDYLLQGVEGGGPTRVDGTAVFLTGDPEMIPTALLHNVKHNKVLHRQNVFLCVRNEDVPFIAEEDRLSVEDLGHEFYRVIARNGFMENPDVPEIMERVAAETPALDFGMPTYVLSRNVVLPSRKPPLARWREWLFIVLMRNALRPTQFFKIPPNQVGEIGRQISL